MREDVETIFGPKRALEDFIEAKQKGQTRFFGVTVHHDLSVIRTCIERFASDAVLIPVTPAEPAQARFLEPVLPGAVKKGIGLAGMKTYFRGLASRLPRYTSMWPFFRFASSQPVSTVVIGCDDVARLEEKVRAAEAFVPLPAGEQKELIRDIAPLDRQPMYYNP